MNTSDAFDEGYDAFFNGANIPPHYYGALTEAWLDGWEKAMAEDEATDYGAHGSKSP